MSCRVWIWNYLGTKTAFGHASMSVYGGTPAGTTYVSWWPNCAAGSTEAGHWEQQKAEYFGMCEPQRSRKLETDIGSEFGNRPDRSVLLLGLDETAIKAFWADLTTDSRAKWSASTTNCACCVVAALKAGGAGKYIGEWDDFWFNMFNTNMLSYTPDSAYKFAALLATKLREAGKMP